MKLSDIIKKYQPLGWAFEYTTTPFDNFWTFKSPRMEQRRGFPEHLFDESDAEQVNVSEENMLKKETYYFILQTYSKKVDNVFDKIKADILRQLETLDFNKKELPDEIKISFDLKLR